MDSNIATKFRRENNASDDFYAGVVGTIIVKKSMKERWTFKTDNEALMIGIMDVEMIKSRNLIQDITDTKHKGYGMASGSWSVFHDSDRDHCKSLKKYVRQFEIDNQPKVITMELDMTQQEYKNGVLKYIFHNKPKQSVKQIRTDGEFSNIAFDNIDITKEYKLAVALSRYGWGKWIQLIYHPE